MLNQPEHCPACNKHVSPTLSYDGWRVECTGDVCARPVCIGGYETKRALLKAYKRACAEWRKAEKKKLKKTNQKGKR